MYVSGDLSDQVIKSRIFAGMYQLVFIGPELLMTNLYWREMMRTEAYQRHLVAFVVVEAHCIIKWYTVEPPIMDPPYYGNLAIVDNKPRSRTIPYTVPHIATSV